MGAIQKTVFLALAVAGVMAMSIYATQACEWGSKMSVWAPSDGTATEQAATGSETAKPMVDG